MKEDIKEILSSFFEQTETDNIKAKHYPLHYLGIKLKAGFGKGNVARIPWIAFLAKDQVVTNGIFPVYYFFKEQYKLILAYGISETERPNIKWLLSPRTETITKYFQHTGITPYKYGASYIYEVYETDKNLDWTKMEEDLKNLIQYYKLIMQGK